MKKIYIAGKLNAMAVDYLYNVHNMMNTAQAVKSAGYSVYVPAIDLMMGIMFGYTKYEDYFDNSQPWLSVADAIFLVPGWDSSEGTKREITLAEERGVPVFSDLEQMNLYFGLWQEQLN